MILKTIFLPFCFRRSLILPLLKKGDPNNVENYRCLSLLNSDTKIYCGLLLNRLSCWVEKEGILNEFQAGFRRNYSTVDNVFNLVNIVQLNFNRNKCTFAFFVDLKNAFDKIVINSMFFKLAQQGLSTKMILALKL